MFVSIFTQTAMSATSGYQNKRFEYLNREEPHCDKTHPAVQRVEIGDGPTGIKVMRVQYCDEAHNNAWDGQCMEYCMEQLDIDTATAAAHTVQQYR
jgi:hypothetical protein